MRQLMGGNTVNQNPRQFNHIPLLGIINIQWINGIQLLKQ